MKKKLLQLLPTTMLGALVIALPGLANAAQPAHCNRACLKNMVNRYLAALVAHDPSRVPIAKHYKFVENTKPMKVGEGLWKTATAVPTTFKIYVPDPVSHQVGFIGVMQENGKPIELGLRLQLHDGQIVQMEHLIARNLRPQALVNLKTPRPTLLDIVPPAERMPRAQMIADASKYYTAIVTNNGEAAPFAANCVRHENGLQTTGNPLPKKPSAMGIIGSLGCAAGIDTHALSYITRIEPRRVNIADPVTGLVFGLSQFRQPMKQKYVTVVGVPGVTRIPMNFKAFDLPAAHIFKVRDGKIHAIEAMGFMMPYDSPTGWGQ